VEGEGILQTIAEIAVAFTGFTGVVAAFGRRSDRKWSDVDILRFRIMLATSLCALLYSVLPFVLFHLGLTSAALWRLGSALLAAQIVANTLYRNIQAWRTGTDSVRAVGGKIPGLVLLTFIVAVVVVQTLNALGMFPQRSFALYLFGVTYFLVNCSFNFVRLVTPTRTDGAA